jgi:glycosyltransferase involved in cell wall biosynthesis
MSSLCAAESDEDGPATRLRSVKFDPYNRFYRRDAGGCENPMLPDSFIAAIGRFAPRLVVFSVVRNEIVRIHAWLRHYRNIGVKTFAVVDNGSTDGTYEILRAQPDVVAARIETSYAASNFGVAWLNELHRRLNPSIWVLFVDADELLVYRGWPDRQLIELADEAAAENCNTFFGVLVDMYPNGSLEEAVVSEQGDLFEVAPCFDRDYHFRIRPLTPWEPPEKKLELIGGPRVRMLSSLERELATTWFSRFIRGQIDRVLPVTPDLLLPWVVRVIPRSVPSLCKAPLVRSGAGVSYTSAHYTRGARLFAENVVLCHFKFLADFAARVRTEAARGEHYRRGAEYIMYADAISQTNRLELAYEGSQWFRTVDQFVELGLIRNIASLLPGPM